MTFKLPAGVADYLRREPARVGAQVSAVFALLASLGVTVDPSIETKVGAFAAAVVPLICGVLVRRSVSPYTPAPDVFPGESAALDPPEAHTAEASDAEVLPEPRHAADEDADEV